MASRQLPVQAVRALTFEDFTKRIEGYQANIGCTLAWVLFHLIEDEIYHRSQIRLIRKLHKEYQS
ncbi:hypothetical protein P1X16_20525 [Hymenobacter sp. YC55]|nr:hypothetical protein [Hymenobacter sp. YC55]